MFALDSCRFQEQVDLKTSRPANVVLVLFSPRPASEHASLCVLGFTLTEMLSLFPRLVHDLFHHI